MGKFLGLELSLSTGPVAGATVGNTKDPLKGEGLSGAGKASPAPTPQSHLPFHLGHHPVSPSPGTLSHTTLCFCPCPDCPADQGFHRRSFLGFWMCFCLLMLKAQE